MAWLNTLLGSDSPKLTRPAKTVTGLAMQKARLSERVLIRRDGYRLPFFASSNVALTFWAVPDLIDPTEQFVRLLLRPGDVFVDVGANVGTVAALAAGVVGPSGRVVAIEPHPRTHANLQRTIAANALHNVACVGVACGAVARTATLTDESRKDDNNKIDDTGSGVPVRMATLAEVLREHVVERVNLLKIDVEGLEESVLRGLGFERDRVEAVYVEVIEAQLNRYGSSTSAIVSLLQDWGFACFRLPDDPDNLVALSKADQLVAIGGAPEPLPGNPALDRGAE